MKYSHVRPTKRKFVEIVPKNAVKVSTSLGNVIPREMPYVECVKRNVIQQSMNIIDVQRRITEPVKEGQN